MRPAGLPTRRPAPPGGAPGPLTPILVRGLWGRVGSTLLMQLLATSDAVAFDRGYPFEDRVLSHLLHLLAPLAGPPPQPQGWWMEDPQQLWWMDPAAFRFSPGGDPLPFDHLEVDRAELHRRAVRGVWQAFSDTARSAHGPGLRFYAEKYGAYAEHLEAAALPVRYLDLVRDPRDVWASIRSFDAARGFYGFGRRPGESEQDFLASYVAALSRRLDAMLAPQAAARSLLVRYEDLVADLPGAAARVGGWLGIRLDAAAVEGARERFRHHMTSASPQESLQRWRTDLGAQEVEVIEAALGDRLARLGYRCAG